jgi:hypothetical protein
MATFDFSGIKSGNTENLETLITNGNSLACHFEPVASYAPGSPASSTTSTWLTTATKTATYSSDEVLIIAGQLYFSCSTAATQGRVSLWVGGVQLGNDYSIACAATGVGGNADVRTLVKGTTTAGGSVTIDLKFSYNTGGGTVYVNSAELYIFALKYRPS